MVLKSFNTLVNKLNELVKVVNGKSMDLNSSGKLLDYHEQKKKYYLSQIKQTILLIQDRHKELAKIENYSNNAQALEGIREVLLELDYNNIDIPKLTAQAQDLLLLSSGMEMPLGLTVDIPNNLPSDIRGEVVEDLHEMQKCYNAACYRSVVILCGRVLEVGLHRKYFEATGIDILEKNPGIGLGKLIAKLSEKEVKFDPGLTQQIHLINQVRIVSVHKKQEPFLPSQAQAQAMMLYTMDVLGKMF